jgi:predicted transcriptional regulator
MADQALFETEESIREKVAAELDRLAKEFERDYPYKAALMFAARFVRGEDCPVGPMTMGLNVLVPERAVEILLGDRPSASPADHERAREALRRGIQDYHDRTAWEVSKLDSWTAEVARGQRTRGGAQ